MLELRPYQRDGLDALYGYWEEGGGSPLLVYPTGAGKSLVIAKLIQELLERFPTLRISVVTHVKELIGQNFLELMRLWPSAPAGIFSAGLNRRDRKSRVLFCGIQSVWRKADDIGPFDLLIVDETHLISRDAGTMYGKFIAALRALTPDMRLVGLTATPYRLDSGRLDDGDGSLFDKVIYEANVRDLIDAGYLSPLISKSTHDEIDLRGVGKRGGEFIPAQLEAAAMRDGLVEAAVAELVARGADRRKWLAFCAGVEHAEKVRDEIRRHGFTCETITGETRDRDQIIRGFKEGRTRCLTSVGVLTTGFNVPDVDLIAMLMSTTSAGRYVQVVGRGFRIAEGKENCLVLDWGGNVRRHGPVDMVEIKPPGEGGGEAPVKECPNCLTFVYAATRICPHCGFEFPPPETEVHAPEADHIPILSQGPALSAVEDVSVVSWDAERHTKFGSPDSLKVTYFAGLMSYREWWALEHAGFARDKALRLWRRHGGAEPAPETVTEALARMDELAMPATIQVRKNGKFFDIVGRRFDVSQGEAA